MDVGTGEALLAELMEDPQSFDKAGRAYELLQAYFSGLSVETLRPLLRSDDVWLQRSASFVASELGKESKPLVNDVIPLLQSEDRHVQNYAMEVLTVCCEGDRAEDFGHVVAMLESKDEGLRQRVISLIANADAEQIKAAVRHVEGMSSQARHQRGLQTLTSVGTSAQEVQAMLEDTDPLIRSYGRIAKKRLQS